MTAGFRRTEATEAEIAEALDALDRDPQRIRAADWPPPLVDLTLPGVYSWWTDAGGAAELSDGTGVAVDEGRIYAGQTGATKWPSGKVGKATLGSRIGSQHLRGRIRGSTFRLTLGVALREPLNLVVQGPKKLVPESEATISAWMEDHLKVAIHPFAERDALKNLEDNVLDVLDPPLNLEGRPPTPLRASLSRLRASLARATASAPDPIGSASPPVTTSGSAAMTKSSGSGRVTLHDEIADILREHGGWITTTEIADAVNRRGRYMKKDGSAIEPFQIHGRTKNYSHLFERNGSRVRLKVGLG